MHGCGFSPINKQSANEGAALEGVRVPKSQLLRRGESISMSLPVVVKPVERLIRKAYVIRKEGEIPQALPYAFQFGNDAL